MGLFYQLPYKVKIQTDDVVSLTNQIKKIQKDTGLEFFEAIQVYELQLKITKADTLDEHLAGFGKLIDEFLGNGQFDLGDLDSSLYGISESISDMANVQAGLQFYDKNTHLRINGEEFEQRKLEFIESLYITYSSLNDDHVMINRLTERPVKDIFENLIKLYRYDFGGKWNYLVDKIRVNDFIKVVTETSTLKYDEQTGYFV